MTTVQDRVRVKSRQPFSALCYSPTSASRSTVRTQYVHWRKLHGAPARCDEERCRFHTEALEWNGHFLPLILDHINGNRLDNRPKNLRYLCPNCDSQLLTRGGKNRGRVAEAEEGTYLLKEADGSKRRVIVARAGSAAAEGIRAAIRN